MQYQWDTEKIRKNIQWWTPILLGPIMWHKLKSTALNSVSGSKVLHKVSICSSSFLHHTPSGKITAPLQQFYCYFFPFPMLNEKCLTDKRKSTLSALFWQLWLQNTLRLLCCKLILRSNGSRRRPAVTAKPQSIWCLSLTTRQTCPRIRRTTGPWRTIALETGVGWVRKPGECGSRNLHGDAWMMMTWNWA